MELDPKFDNYEEKKKIYKVINKLIEKLLVRKRDF